MLVALPRRMLLAHGPASSRSVCLTFDDGPHPEHTPRLLDALKAHGIVATFFLIGRCAEQYPAIARRIADEGHAIGNHSFTHELNRRVSSRELIEEMRQTNRLFTEIIGDASPLYRPVQGKVSASSLLKLWRARQTVVLWNVDPKDYARESSEEVRDWFQEHPLRSGDMVLMHDNHPHAAEVIPDLAASARERGLTFSTVDSWLK